MDDQQNNQPQQPITNIINNYAQPNVINTETYSGLAVAGFVLSLIPSFYICQVIGLILASIGFSQSGKPNKKGRGLAIAGIVISLVVLAFPVLFMIGVIGSG